VQQLSGPDIYNAAAVRDTLDPTGQYQVFVSTPRHVEVDPDVGRNYEISLRRLSDSYEWYIVGGTKGADYDPAYCQADPRYIAWVSQQSGGDDIFVVDLLSATRSGAPLRTARLTENDWPWDKHPSWSADCKQIVFSSNRDGRDQLWVMDFLGMDYPGGNPRKLRDDPYNDWNPVWIKPPPVSQ
jgi:Tol biopolymer transport system component